MHASRLSDRILISLLLNGYGMPKNPILAYHHLYHLSRTGCPISLKQLKSQFQQFDQLYQSQGTAIDHCDLEQLMCLSYLLGKIHEDTKFYHLTNAVFYYSYVCQLAENNAFRCIFGNKAIRHMEKLISKQPKEAIKKSSKTKRILYRDYRSFM